MKNIIETMEELGLKPTESELQLRGECIDSLRKTLGPHFDDTLIEVVVDGILNAGRVVGANQAFRCGERLVLNKIRNAMPQPDKQRVN